MHYGRLLSCDPYIFIVFILDGKVSDEPKSREFLSSSESESEDERERARSSVLVKKVSKRPLEETSKRPLEEKGDEEDEFPLYFGRACFLSCAPYIVIMCCFRW